MTKRRFIAVCCLLMAGVLAFGAVFGDPLELHRRSRLTDALPDGGHGYDMARCGEGVPFEVTQEGAVTVWDAVG